MSQLNSSATPFIGTSSTRMGSGAGGSIQGQGHVQHPQQPVMGPGLSHTHHSGNSSPIPQNTASSSAGGGAGGTNASNTWFSSPVFVDFSGNAAAAGNNNPHRTGANGGASQLENAIHQVLNNRYNAQTGQQGSGGGGGGAAGGGGSGNPMQQFVSHQNFSAEEQRVLYQAQQQLNQLQQQLTPLQMQQGGAYSFAQQQPQLQIYRQQQQQQTLAQAQSVNNAAAAAVQGGFGTASPYGSLTAGQHPISFPGVQSPSPIPPASMLGGGGVPGGQHPTNPMSLSKSSNSSISSAASGFSSLGGINGPHTVAAAGGAGRPLNGDEHIRRVSGPPFVSSADSSIPNLSQSPIIRDVWAANLEEEFEVIRSLIADYPYVAMDTEFPGAVAKAVGNFDSPTMFYYQSLRVNVNMSKLIQVGLTLFNERGEVPENYCTWQFNFSFSCATDIYISESIQLLEEGGINFDYLQLFGIDVNHFASLLLSSGLVQNPDVRWLAFHAGYDFGYLTKILYDADLPENVDEFLHRFHLLFPSLFDVKHLLRQTQYSHSSGLDTLAELLSVHRFGSAHQAGSDSLLTGHCYFRLFQDVFKGVLPKNGNGILYGLTEDRAAAESGNSASGAFNACHHTIPTSSNAQNGAMPHSSPNG